MKTSRHILFAMALFLAAPVLAQVTTEPSRTEMRKVTATKGNVNVIIDEKALEATLELAVENALRSLEDLERLEIHIAPIEIDLSSLNLAIDPIEIRIPNLDIDIEPIIIEPIDIDLDELGLLGDIDVDIEPADFDFDFDFDFDWDNDDDEGNRDEDDDEWNEDDDDDSDANRDQDKSKDKDKNKTEKSKDKSGPKSSERLLAPKPSDKAKGLKKIN